MHHFCENYHEKKAVSDPSHTWGYKLLHGFTILTQKVSEKEIVHKTPKPGKYQQATHDQAEILKHDAQLERMYKT